jgi:hypothetical protein
MNDSAAGAPEPVDRIALIAATVALLIYGFGGDYERPDPVRFLVLATGAVGLAGALARKRWAGLVVLAGVLALGVYMRVLSGDNRASDVMLATNEALTVAGQGGNPYTHIYAMTNPPGGLFGYPPGEIAFYGLAYLLDFNVFRVDMLAGIIGLGLIACLAPLVGDGLAALALGGLAVAVDVIFHSTDGSNDTAASFLVLLGIVTLAWSAATRGRVAQSLWWTSAVTFGWVIAFKEYALPIAVFVALYLWRTDARRARGWIAAAAATTAVLVLPYFVWNPIAFVTNVGGALLVHQNNWGRNVWRDVLSFVPGAGNALGPWIPLVMLLAFGGLAVALWRRPAANLGAAFLQGCALVATLFVLARWTSMVYYVFLAPLIATGVALTLGAERNVPRKTATMLSEPNPASASATAV